MTCINWSAVSESTAAAGELAATAAPMRRIVRVTLRVTVAAPRHFSREFGRNTAYHRTSEDAGATRVAIESGLAHPAWRWLRTEPW